MDRQIVYPGQIPLETDNLYPQRYQLQALGEFIRTVMGTPSVVGGMQVIPTTPASLAVQVLPGSICALENIDDTDYGSLPAIISQQTMKQGILAATTPLTLTPPTTSGYAISYLIQAAFQEDDEDPIVLPYYNSADPNQPFSGPDGSGVAQMTIRRGRVVVSAKAGVAATSGTQVAPSPDAGYVRLAVVVVAQGASQLTSNEISIPDYAAYLPSTLPLVPDGVQSGSWVYAQDTGTANALVVKLYTIPAQYKAGMGLRVLAAASNTGATTINVNGLGTKAIKRRDGTDLQANDILAGAICVLIYDGNSFQLAFGGSGNTTINISGAVDYYAIDSGTANHVIAVFSPAITSLTGGLWVKVKVANNNTGGSDITVNGLSAVSIVRRDGSALQANDMLAGEIVILIYEATSGKFQLKTGPFGSALPSSAIAPIYPEILTLDNTLALTLSTGQVVVNAGQAFLWRGLNQVSTDDYSAPSRTFATAANKTYHLRWTAANGFQLKDLANNSYNPSVLAEGDRSFDATYDDMLIAVITTSGTNVLTATPLKNKAMLNYNGFNSSTPVLGGSSGPQYDEAFLQATFTLNWARTPSWIHSGAVGAGVAGTMNGVANLTYASLAPPYNNPTQLTSAPQATRYGMTLLMGTDWLAATQSNFFGNMFFMAVA